jgi:hypothetical protein
VSARRLLWRRNPSVGGAQRMRYASVCALEARGAALD